MRRPTFTLKPIAWAAICYCHEVAMQRRALRSLQSVTNAAG